MKTRILSAAIGVPVLFAVLFFLPPVYLTALVAVICVLSAFEFLRAVGANEKKRIVVYAAAAAVIVPFGEYFSRGEDVFRAALFLLLVVMAAEAVVAYEKNKTIGWRRILAVLFAGTVIPMFLTSLVKLKMMENGRLCVLLPIITAFLSDAGGYFAGRFFGKTKAFPKTSPHKTVAGCIGGLVCCAVSLVIYGLIVLLCTDYAVHFGRLVVYGIVGSLATQLGDLTFSLIKREVDIKDFGNLIPGHGGALDRFDSMTFAAPVICALMCCWPAF